MDAAGLTPGGFYKQFESREALVAEAFELAFQQSGESWHRVRADAHAQESAAARVTGGISALIRHYFRRRSAERNCPILTFAHPVSSETAGDDAGSEYALGTERLFEQFREESTARPRPNAVSTC
jgi:TetR/AcrR family transcriptional repressor of nem operon